MVKNICEISLLKCMIGQARTTKNLAAFTYYVVLLMRYQGCYWDPFHQHHRFYYELRYIFISDDSEEGVQ